MRLTYNQIIKLLRDFTDSHYILNAFGNGEVWEMVQSCLNTDINYPMMWVEDQSNSINKGEEIFNFRIYFLNQVATLKEKENDTLNETNINEVKSDMRQCASDLISYFAQDTNYPELTIDRNVSLTSFVDDTNDKLTGWYIDLRFKQAYTSNACYLPMEGIAPPPSVSCDPILININGVEFGSFPSGDTVNINVIDLSDNPQGSLIDGNWVVPFNDPTPPIPDPEPYPAKFIPLTWSGVTSEYNSYIDISTATNYNRINRDSAPQSFNTAIYSDQVINSDNSFYFVGDSINGATSNGFFVGISLASKTGASYDDIDYSIFVNGLSVLAFEGLTNMGTIATLTSGQLWRWILEYNSGTNEINVYINNLIVHTFNTSYTSEDINVRLLGRNPNNVLGDHIALVQDNLPNNFLTSIGDSITYGRSISGDPKTNYIELTLSNLNNSYYSNPNLAVSGNTTSQMVSDQLPYLASTYDATRSKNVLTIMGGINDLRTSVPLATIQANLTTLVNDAQTVGFTVVIQTVLKDFNTDWVDRYTLNDWIVSNSIGADYVVDYRSTDLETNPSLFEVDMLHPNALGMQEIADNLWLTINNI